MSAPPRPFAPEEDRFIIEHYSTLTLVQIAEQLGRNWGSLQQRTKILARQHRLNLLTRAYHREWTPQEEAELLGRLGWDSLTVIARALHRTRTSVVVRCKRLGLSRLEARRRRARYNARDVGTIFGVDAKAITHSWMVRGWIHGERGPLGAGQHQQWLFTYDEIEHFIRECAPHYDRHRIETGTWWRELADTVAASNPLLTTAQAALRSGFHASTLIRWIKEGRLQAIRTTGASVQGDWRIAASELDRFIAANPLSVRLSRGVKRGRYGATA